MHKLRYTKLREQHIKRDGGKLSKNLTGDTPLLEKCASGIINKRICMG